MKICSIDYKNVTLIVSYGRLKFAEEDVPSAETNSVLLPECVPPNNRTSPDWRPQQRC